MAAYRQCQLTLGHRSQVAYIPARFGVLGETVKLRKAGAWEDGWVVTGVYAELDERLLPHAPKAIREHRKRTGDALPKQAPLSMFNA